MVADSDGARKPAAMGKDRNVPKQSAMDYPQDQVARLLRSGLAQVNLEVQQFTVLFEGHNVGNVQPGTI